jgi:Retrotransposon gag protein
MADQQQLLLQLYQQLQTDIQQLRTDDQQLRADNQQLHAEILSLREEVQTLRASPPSMRQILPDPPKFDGKPYMLRTWLPAMRAKIREDGRVGQNAFYYTWDRLEASQQGLALLLLDTAESTQAWDHEEIFTLLERVNHNPYAQQEARDKLTHIRQGEEGLSAYIVRFERLLYEAGAKDSWPDDIKISTFTNGLRSTLKTLVQQQLTVPSEYNGYVQLVQQLDRRSRSAAPRPSPAPPAGDPMQIGSIEIAALDLNANSHQRATSTSPELRWDRRKQGLCVRCGSQDHWVHRCPLLPYSHTGSHSASLIASPPPTGKHQVQRINGIPAGSSASDFAPDTDEEEDFDSQEEEFD